LETYYPAGRAGGRHGTAKLLDAAPFKPDIANALKQAFDEAWASIVRSIDPTTVENARLSLAHALVAHAGLLGTDVLAALKPFEHAIGVWPLLRDRPRFHSTAGTPSL
jgi:hypothetical protein